MKAILLISLLIFINQIQGVTEKEKKLELIKITALLETIN